MLRPLVSASVLAVLLSAPALGQQWAEKMFNKREHGFGTVARGSDTVYRFEVTNLYKEDIEITNVRSSCGCTQPSIENPVIKTYQKGYVVARFNTSGTHLGNKGATVTVSLRSSKGHRAEVQVRVHGYIRSDLVFEPGAVRLGTVDEGTTKEQLVRVNYLGGQSWRINDVTNDNDYFEVELREAGRGGGRVAYDLLVRLKDTVPAGYLKDQITLVTNDRFGQKQRVPLSVEGRIIPEISVTPESLFLGQMTAGQPVTKKLVVRGKTPFRIVSIDCGGDQCFSFKKSDEMKVLHLVEVTYTPQTAIGKMQQKVTIRTEGARNSTASCLVSADVIGDATTTGYRGDGTDQVAGGTVN